MMRPLLAVHGLEVGFTTPDGNVQAVKNMNFELSAGQTLGIVGESGSGKSQTVLALMGLLATNGRATGSAVFDGRELLGLPESDLNQIRGARIAMIFQDPMTALNPYLTIGAQMVRVLSQHQGLRGRAAMRRCGEMLDAAHIPEAQQRLSMYPHELSGGMRQRVMIATALLCQPMLLIADEPTTALDVTVQAQILELLKELRGKFDTSIILITHDLGVVAGFCDEILVMRQGMVVERGGIDNVFESPSHPYTRGLLAAVPRLCSSGAAAPLPAVPFPAILSVNSLQVIFDLPAERWFGTARKLRAVNGVSLELLPGETLGVVGESGCGKSTLARAILQLVPASAGRICLLNHELGALDRKDLREFRRHMQIIFQDPLASLNPRMTVRDIVAEPLRTFHPELSRLQLTDRVVEILHRVGLERAHLNRYPHEFSGGQCQRIGIARALILKPRLIICDEPVSALDVSVQAKIVRLLIDLQAEFGVSLIFIAHDLAVVRQISHRIMVMYLGRVVEVASEKILYERPLHPYTQALLQAAPVPDPRLERQRGARLLEGDVPVLLESPAGCAFRSRCRYATAICGEEVPSLRPSGGALVACHHADHLQASG
jgi:peptide/nickel transport system ATP-binding protein